MKTNLKTKLIATALAAALAALTAGAYVARSDSVLTEKPPRLEVAAPAKVSVPSSLVVPIRLSAKALEDLANEVVPTSIDIPEDTIYHKHSWTKNPLNGNRITIYRMTVKGSGKVKRTSPIKVVAEGDGFVVSTTVHASFEARKGSLTETAHADAKISMKVSVDVGESWTPIVSVTPTYSWINRPEARLFDLFTLSLGSVAAKALNSEIGKQQVKLQAVVSQKLPLKQFMEVAWAEAHTKLQVDEAPKAWLSLDPVSAHMMTPKVEGNDLMLRVGVVANVALSTDEPARPDAEKLPALRKTPPLEPGFKAAVPIHVGYDVLERALLTEFVDHPIRLATPAGEAKIAISDVVVYPSSSGLVIGAKVAADLPERWLDTKGWVYFHAQPSFDAKNKVLRLENASFARSVDNTLVRVASAALAPAIVDQLQKRSSIDLSGQLDSALVNVNAKLGPRLQDVIRAKVAALPRPLGDFLARTDVAAKIDGVSAVDVSLDSGRLTLLPIVRGSLAVKVQPATRSGVSVDAK